MTNRSCSSLLLLSLAVWISCGGDDSTGPDNEPCGPDTCDGCCQGDTCVAGSEDSACGSGGEACESCSAESTCEQGSCVALACAETCAGCCEGGVCQTGEAAQACGSGGAECTACATGDTCQEGACGLDPGSRWDVIAVRGLAFEDNVSGGDWDFLPSTLPEPFVELATENGEERISGSSNVVQDTLEPVWDQVVLGDVGEAALSGFGIDATMLDDDGAGAESDTMGSCHITVGGEAFGEGEQEFVCQPDFDAGVRGWTLIWRLQRR
jgi:hypothetical protein